MRSPIQNRMATSNWMEISNDTERFLNLTLSLIHPALFQMGLDMLRKIRVMDDTRDIAQQWQSIYTGISVICNRITPFHRDRRGRPEWFDLLLNYSEAGDSPIFQISDLGLKLKYSSGTVIGFCGSIFEHGVELWGVRNRVCYAHFMRESVRARLEIPAAEWVYRTDYLLNKSNARYSEGKESVDRGNVENDAMSL